MRRTEAQMMESLNRRLSEAEQALESANQEAQLQRESCVQLEQALQEAQTKSARYDWLTSNDDRVLWQLERELQEARGREAELLEVIRTGGLLREDLTQRAEKAEQDAVKADLQADELERERDTAIANVEQMNELSKELQGQIEGLRRERDDLEAALGEARSYETRLDHTLEQVRRERDEARAEADELRDTNEGLKKHELVRKLAQAESELAEARAERDRAIAGLAEWALVSQKLDQARALLREMLKDPGSDVPSDLDFYRQRIEALLPEGEKR